MPVPSTDEHLLPASRKQAGKATCRPSLADGGPANVSRLRLVDRVNDSYEADPPTPRSTQSRRHRGAPKRLLEAIIST